MVTGALPRPARHTTALLTSVVLFVVLSFPVTAADGRPESAPLPPHGLLSAPEEVPDRAEQGPTAARERADLPETKVSVGPPASTCDQRSLPRDLPDAVPGCALRLAMWDQPWWPLPPPTTDPVPSLTVPEDLPPTRAPPPAANTAI